MSTYRYILPPSVAPHYSLVEVYLQRPPLLDANPFIVGRLSGEFVAPDGRCIAVQGFCDRADGSLFRLRFLLEQEGDYTYSLAFADHEESARADGVVRCVPSRLAGPVRVDSEHPYHLCRADGSRPFLLSKTAWRLAVAPDPFTFIDQAAARGFTCLRLALEADAADDPRGDDVWPWGDARPLPDLTRFAVRFWQRLEQIVEHAARRQMLIAPVIFTRQRRQPPAPIPDPEMERYWGYLLARLAPYPNIVAWELFHEHAADEPYQAYMASYLRVHDPYHHLITTSWPTGEGAAWPDAPWIDLVMVHMAASSDPARHSLDAYYRRTALAIHRYGKPAWCGQSGRERVDGNDDPVHRRKQAWVWSISGNYWNYHSWGGCEGIATPMWGPGEEFCLPLRVFWERHTRWWEMQPDAEAILSHPECDFVYSLTSSREVVVYLVNERTGTPTPAGHLALRCAPGEYQGAFYHPASGYEQPLADVVHIADEPAFLATPPFMDDLVIHLRRAAHE